MKDRNPKARRSKSEVCLKSLRRAIRFCQLRIKFMLISSFSHRDFMEFQCNICGKVSSSPLSIIQGRETPSCHYCGSTLRFRSIINALSLELFGKSLVLSAFPDSSELIGIGMSDSEIYAEPLSRKFKYTNTFYHKSPELDIVSIVPKMKNQADFIISSDVFEHIPPPIEIAFQNLYALLKNNGVCIFSAPYTTRDATEEYFPDLFFYKIVSENGKNKLVNKTKDGAIQVFDDLRFHGGSGSTLEMRFFSRSSLLNSIASAGFKKIKIHEDNVPEYGILWEEHSPVIISMSKSETAN